MINKNIKCIFVLIKMKSLDYISKSVTIESGNNRVHASKVGALITIIIYITGFGFFVYSIISLFKRENPSSNFTRKYVDELGEFEISNKGLFHYIYLRDRYENYVTIDETFLNIAGYEYNFNAEVLATYTYGPCNI